MARRSSSSPFRQGHLQVPRRSYGSGLPSRTSLKLFLLALVLALMITSLLWLKDNDWDFARAWNQATAPDKYVSGSIETGFDRSSPSTYSTAAEVLKTLPVKEHSAATAYNRLTDFGEPWTDVDSNGCDTRDDVLDRDLISVQKSGKCKVTSGILIDPYTSEKLDFQRGSGTSGSVPIDHVVPLSNAWSSGASLLSQSDRLLIANDPLNLQSTGEAVNTQKSDSDASQWLPQKSYQCEYVARQISVKAAYSLWVTPAEKSAMEKVLSSCPDQPAYRSTLKK